MRLTNVFVSTLAFFSVASATTVYNVSVGINGQYLYDPQLYATFRIPHIHGLTYVLALLERHLETPYGFNCKNQGFNFDAFHLTIFHLQQVIDFPCMSEYITLIFVVFIVSGNCRA